MRLVARLAIAIATLLSSAMPSWGQQPLGALRGSRSDAQGPLRVAQAQEQPPASLEGTWVSDEGAPITPTPDPIASGDPAATGEYAGEGSYDPSQQDGSFLDGQCPPDQFGGGAAGGHCGLLGGLCKPLWCSDMWNEVHAHNRIYASVDYLSFWAKGNALPPLVTTSPIGTPQAQAGVLPESATTAILFGNGRVDTDQRNGGRINIGYWLIDGEFLGVEGQYWTLQQENTVFNASSNFTGDPNAQILARPFTNVDPNLVTAAQDSAIVAFPAGFTLPGGVGTLDGSINARTTSNIQSANATLRKLLWIDFTMQRRVDVLLGYRFFRVDDSVTINDNSTFTPSSGIIPTTQIISQDLFSSKNLFNGGEIGLNGQSQHGRLGIELLGKVAFGNNQQITNISGSNTVTSLGNSTTHEGGLLAQPSNIGKHERNVFAILPEADVNLKWDITCHLRATAGYTFVYMNRVQRSGDAINLNVNPTQFNGGTLVGAAQPSFNSTDTTFWAHGLSTGVEYRW